MFLFKLVRKIFAQLKSAMTPSQIAGGVFLGVLAGLTPAGLHWMLLFLLALLFNISMAAFLLSWGSFKLLFLAIAPLAFRAGTTLLGGGHPGAESFVLALTEAPLLAWMGFDRYLVAGGYAVALPLALAAGLLVRILVPLYRKAAAATGGSDKYQKAMKFFLFRFLHWVIAGKDKEIVEPKKRFILLRPFRPYMIVAIPLVSIGLTVGAGFYAQWAMKDLAAGSLGKVLGVKCTFKDIAYAFFGQELKATDFQLPDPSATKEDMVRMGKFEADLGFTELLSRRFHVEKLAVADVSFNVARNSDGKLNVTELPAAQPAPDAPPGEKSAYEDYTKWVGEHSKDMDWAKMWEKVQEYRAKRAEEAKKAAQDPKQKIELAFDPAATWSAPRRHPLVRVDLIEISNLSLSVTDRSAQGGGSSLPPITNVKIQGKQLSTQPGWNGQPMELVGEGLLAGGKSGKISFKVSMLPEKTDSDFTIAAVPLVELKSLYEKSLPVAVQDGAATIDTKGKILSGVVDAGVKLRIEKLKVAGKPENPKILGLDEQTSGYAIQGINAYGEKLPVEIDAGIKGPVGSPEIDCKVPFLEIAKKGLEMLGKKELQKYIDQIGGEVDAVKKIGMEKLAPVQESAKKAGAEAIKAAQTGDTKGLQEAVQKGTQDVKSVPAAKDDVKKKIEDSKDALDLFKKKKKE